MHFCFRSYVSNYDKVCMKSGEAIVSPMVTKAIERAQKRERSKISLVEKFNRV